MQLSKPALARALAATIALSPAAFAQKAPMAENPRAGTVCREPKEDRDVPWKHLAIGGGIFVAAYGMAIAYSLLRISARKTPRPEGVRDAEDGA